MSKIYLVSVSEYYDPEILKAFKVKEEAKAFIQRQKDEADYKHKIYYEYEDAKSEFEHTIPKQKRFNRKAPQWKDYKNQSDRTKFLTDMESWENEKAEFIRLNPNTDHLRKKERQDFLNNLAHRLSNGRFVADEIENFELDDLTFEILEVELVD